MLAIARAFAWYPNPSASFDGFQDEQMIERYLLLTTSVMKTYCEIYSLDERAYMMISNESSMTPILQYFRLLWGMLWIVGPARVYRQIERGTEALSSLAGVSPPASSALPCTLCSPLLFCLEF